MTLSQVIPATLMIIFGCGLSWTGLVQTKVGIFIAGIGFVMLGIILALVEFIENTPTGLS